MKSLIVRVIGTILICLSTACQVESDEGRAARKSLDKELQGMMLIEEAGLWPRQPRLPSSVELGVTPQGDDPPLIIEGTLQSFDPVAMEGSIAGQLAKQGVAGFAYSISRNGELIASLGQGDAIRATDETPIARPFLDTSRVHVASVSKPITAVAMLHLIEEFDEVDLSTRFFPLIESSFSDSSDAVSDADIEIRDLLKHTSGLDKKTSAYCEAGEIEAILSADVDEAQIGTTHVYNNVNTCLLREVIEHVSGMSYIDYVAANVLEPIGAQGVSCFQDETESATRYYASGAAGNGVLWGSYDHNCSAYGWYASARDLARLMTHFRYDTVLTEQSRETMLGDCVIVDGAIPYCLGFYKTIGSRGVYYGHNGVWDWDGGGVRAAVLSFDTSIDASLVINTAVAVDPIHVLKTAYESAFN